MNIKYKKYGKIALYIIFALCLPFTLFFLLLMFAGAGKSNKKVKYNNDNN